MESPPALARLRAVAGQLDAPGAVAFVLHCFLDEELAGGAFERETVKYACGVHGIVSRNQGLAASVRRGRDYWVSWRPH